jgi:hypothetical protein
MTTPKTRIPDATVQDVQAAIAQARVHMDLAGYELTRKPEAVPGKLGEAIRALTGARDLLAPPAGAAAPRIRWEPNEDGRDYTAAIRGYAGAIDSPVFAIYPPKGRMREWVLCSDLPGQERCRIESDSPDQLKLHAERLLEMFAVAIGTPLCGCGVPPAGGMT